MRQITFIAIGCLLILSSCAPKITTSISRNYSPLDYREDVRVFGLQDPIPGVFEEIGVVKIGDKGFSSDCGWDVVIDKAKMEARKAGGNAIKITSHIPPSVFGSSCDRITATILKVASFENIPVVAVADSSLITADYAILHVYRNSGIGALVAFDLHLGDTVICRVKNKWKKTIRIRKDGLDTLWARTEAREELPVKFMSGNEYYVRCSITMGALVGRPKLELIDNSSGKAEFQSIKLSQSDKRDLIIMNDGREIECQINNEDPDNVYFVLFKDGKTLKTQISKAEIKSIQRSE